MKFEELGLIPELLSALSRAGYERPTPIQEQAIGPTLAGRDVLGCAQTGTGKTAAFSLPILQRLDALAGEEVLLRALILTPTRELAAQIQESLATYGKDLDLHYTVIFGGVNEKPQIEELRRGVDILVATPGRLLDLMDRGFVKLKNLEIFVLDEADRMLDMGFIHDVRKVIAALPERRQTLLFSATMPPEIKQLADRMMKDPVFVAVTPVASTAERIEQRVYFTDNGNKRRLLLQVLKDPNCTRALVFSRTKHGANRVVKHLHDGGVRAQAIHGNKSQAARVRALEAFRDGELAVLVATDIAARGLDIDDVSHVVNFDLPNVPETYVHRIGRTARAGREGIAVSFCDVEERPYLVDIERLIQRHIERVENHPYPPSQPLPPQTNLTGRQGQRQAQAPSGEGRRDAGSGGRGRSRPRRPRRGGGPDRGARPRAGSG